MKALVKENRILISEGRWDIDYHLPAEGILRYPKNRLVSVSNFADVSKKTRDPKLSPDTVFTYIDIASVDVETGTITNPQELTGEEAPSRARKVVRAFDIVVSTVRPTRGAIAVVPPELDNQICSTGFCVLQCKENVNPYYLHFILNADSTLEQFRKFSTGSSYPAILDEDVLKTLVPDASVEEQDIIAHKMMASYAKRQELLEEARREMMEARTFSINILEKEESNHSIMTDNPILKDVTINEIQKSRVEILNENLPLLSPNS